MTKYTPKTKPFPHQSSATLRAARARNYAFFMEPRLGKSKAGLDTVGIWHLAGHVNRVTIICPAIAKEVWAHQIALHYPYPYHCETFDEEWGDKAAATHFFIASREETFRRVRQEGGRGYKRAKQKVLERWEPDVFIFDESHEYKRPSAVGAQDGWRMVRRLRKNGYAPLRYARPRTPPDGKPWVLLMSGTPSPTGYGDLFPQFRIMNERILGTSKSDFSARYLVYGSGKRQWTVVGYRNEKLLDKKVRDNSSTVTAEQAGLAGKVFYQRLDVKLPPAAKEMYLELAKEFMVEWEGGTISAKNAGVKRMRLLQLCGGFTTAGQQIHRAKVDKLRAYLTLLWEQEQSVVVYARFTPEVAAATEICEGLGYRTFRVDGTVTSPLRQRGIRALWAVNPVKPTAVCFQHQAGSRAIELVGARETVYYSAPDGWVEYRQTAARNQGPRQNRPVRQTFLVCPGTVDVSVLRGLRRKEGWHDQLMRDPRAYLFGLV